MNANERLLEHHFGSRPNGWTVRRLGDFFTERTELSSDLGKYPLHSFTIENGVTEKTDRYERSFLLKDADNNLFKVVHPGDFVVNPMNLRFGAVGMSEKNVPVTVSAYYDVLALKASEIEADYLLEVLRSQKMLNIYDRVAIGSLLEKKRVHLSLFEELRVFVPADGELQFISSVANGWRKSVALLERLVDAKRDQKQSLMHQLLSGKTRFKDFKGQKWNTFRLGEIFSERVEIGRTDLPLVSITGQNGVVPRDSLAKRDTSSEDKSKYLRIKPGDIGYNTMRMWQGVSGLSNLDGIVSPAYTVCIPSEKIDAQFAAFLFKHAPLVNLFRRYSQGLVDDTLSLKFPNFAQIHVAIPNVIEQRRIAETLTVCNGEIELLQKQLDALREQKRGLMQKLLTGKVRVKVRKQD